MTGAKKDRLTPEGRRHEREVARLNEELRQAKAQVESGLARYADLYDFSPLGYFTLDGTGRIRELNMTGATMLGLKGDRPSRRLFQGFLVSGKRREFEIFLKKAITALDRQVLAVSLVRTDGTSFWAELAAKRCRDSEGREGWCRMAVTDIATSRQAEESRSRWKEMSSAAAGASSGRSWGMALVQATIRRQAEEEQRRFEVLASTNRRLQREILRRRAVEEALRKSEQDTNRLLVESRRIHRQLRRLSHRILQVQEEERKQVSYVLHDEISQTLVGINLHLEVLGKAVAVDPALLREKVTSTQELVHESLNIVHRFARELRPAQLDDNGLISSLRSYVEIFPWRSEVTVRLEAFDDVEKLGNEKRTVLYRVAQEALTNVGKHANASTATVSFERVGNLVRMKVSDDGKSFEVDKVLQQVRNRRLGVISMQERVEMVGGTFKITSSPAEGTTVWVDIPFGRSFRTAPPWPASTDIPAAGT